MQNNVANFEGRAVVVVVVVVHILPVMVREVLILRILGAELIVVQVIIRNILIMHMLPIVIWPRCQRRKEQRFWLYKTDPLFLESAVGIIATMDVPSVAVV